MKKKLVLLIIFVAIIGIIIFIKPNNSKKNNIKEEKTQEDIKENDAVEEIEKEEVEDTKEEIKQEEKIEEKQVEVKQEENNTISKTSKGYNIEVKDGITYIKGILIANKSYDLPSSYNPGGLLSVFTTNYDKMENDASKEGINLNIISGFRSYQTQDSLYNRYVARDGKEAADTYSARPGHSEHQTGLAADINSVDTDFQYTPEGKWLNENCYKYGFIIRYPKGKESITGYMFEPWHIRYVGDIAEDIYNNGNWITLEEYLGIDSIYR